VDAPALTTERLVLRSFEPHDTEAFARVLEDREAMRPLWSIPGTPDDLHEHADSYVTSSIASWRASGYGLWAIWTLATPTDPIVQLIGFSGFVGDAHTNLRPPEGLELGWGLRPDHQGRGLAREATAAAIAFGFAGLRVNRQIAITGPQNQSSRQLMERLGMTFERTIEAWGGSCVLYALARDDFERVREARGPG